MELAKFIQQGIQITGSVDALADAIGMSASNVTAARRGRRGLTDKACVLLADLVRADRFAVLAARNAATAKEADNREFWSKFARAATVAFAVMGGASHTTDSQTASDTLFVTPEPATPEKTTAYDPSSVKNTDYTQLPDALLRTYLGAGREVADISAKFRRSVILELA